MSFEAQLKIRYAQAHNRLINGGIEKQHIEPSFPPVTIRQISRPQPPAPKTAATVDSSPQSTELDKPSMWGLLRWVSVTEGVSITDLRGAKHTKAIYRARFIFCYLARVYAGMPLPRIGAFIGGRDHTTILNAVNRIRVCRLSDAQLCQDIAYYEEELEKNIEKPIMKCPHCGGVIPSYPHSVPK